MTEIKEKKRMRIPPQTPIKDEKQQVIQQTEKLPDVEFKGAINPTHMPYVVSKINKNLVCISLVGCLIQAPSQDCNYIKSSTKLIDNQAYDIDCAIVIYNKDRTEVGKLNMSDGMITITRDGNGNFSDRKNGFCGCSFLVYTKSK